MSDHRAAWPHQTGRAGTQAVPQPRLGATVWRAHGTRFSRREFVRLSALGAAGAGSAAPGTALGAVGQADSLSHPQRPPLGLVTYLIGRDMDLEALISLCETTGLECLELRSTHAHGVEPSISAEERQAVRERFAQTSVLLFSLGSACEYHSPDEAVVRQNMESTKAFCQLAHDVGALGVKVRPNGLPDGVPVEQTLRQIGEALRECGEFAAELGTEVWLEVHGSGTSHVPHIRTIMDIADHPQVGVCWNCNGSDIVDGSIRESFLLVRDRIRTLHIHDLYTNDYPWKELFSLLVETRFGGPDRNVGPAHGWALCEMGESSDPERVMHYYRALYDALYAEAAREARLKSGLRE